MKQGNRYLARQIAARADCDERTARKALRALDGDGEFPRAKKGEDIALAMAELGIGSIRDDRSP